ncbi:hypothetical protein PILCRDRAFT_9794 [Piloderma croceum F 1598]|uniref:Uncharacterized protein n=1 Tax=Piloderma croceum (strain F 1598) TaxID=765440 RepID=A0A0C3F6I8_PILCF|nr:hypothetical protein PILCRDRAFT_9794 [Piloderma croceum F 1598]
MPRIETPKHRVQRAFAPFIFKAGFRPERLLTPPPLPWLATFPPHNDGQLPINDSLPNSEGSTASKVVLVKMKRPNGEPGRSGERGFNLKSTLNLPKGIYEDMLEEVNRLANEHLKVAATITNQSQDALEVVYKQLKTTFPVLEERFEGDWPAKAMIQSFLKNTSAKSSTLKSK